MSARDHTRAIRPYLGSIERPEPMLRLLAPWPWAAEVHVTALNLAGYEGTRFEVSTHWLGPPMRGAPPSLVPVHGNDTLLLEDEQLARTVANRARNSLARAELPDLWILSGQVRRDQ